MLFPEIISVFVITAMCIVYCVFPSIDSIHAFSIACIMLVPFAGGSFSKENKEDSRTVSNAFLARKGPLNGL